MPDEQVGPITELLRHWRQGDEAALQALVPLVYKELRRLAHYYLRSERPDHTLQSTALVHEAYLRMVGAETIPQKRDAGVRIVLDNADAIAVQGDAELLALDAALEDLSRIDERQGKIVEMKFFGGLSAPEISEALGISRATVDRDWATARVWLHRQMSRTGKV